MAPNIVVIMADQHRADMMGCAAMPGCSTPNLDALAAEGVRFSRVSCQGPLCMPARASFMTERYVRDHGVYTNWAEIAPDVADLRVGAARGRLPHDVARQGAPVPRRGRTPRATSTTSRRGCEALGFAEVHETGDKFSGATPNRYTDHLRDRGLLDAYRQHIADRSYQGENESGQNATKRVPMWDATPMPLPLDAYIDAWHGARGGARGSRSTTATNRSSCSSGSPVRTTRGTRRARPSTATATSTCRCRDRRAAPTSTAPAATASCSARSCDLSDTETMTDDAIRGMRRAYSADVSVIDDAVGRIVAALDGRGLLDNTWVIYTSDHGEMGGNHGMMSKCVLYEPAVRVPLIVRPPGGCDAARRRRARRAPRRAGDGARDRAAPAVPASEGRSLLGYVDGARCRDRARCRSARTGASPSFETERYKLVVDEDAVAPCQLFDLADDPDEDHNLARRPRVTPVVDEIMETHVRPFLATAPVRPHRSPFTG